MGGRENWLPRYCFVTFGTTLDNHELVLLASENRSFLVSPTAMPSHTHSPLWNPLQGRAGGVKGGREGSTKQTWLQVRVWGGGLCHHCQSTAGYSSGHPNVLVIKFWKHTYTLMPALYTIICFSLLRNLLSRFQNCVLPPPTLPFLPPQYYKLNSPNVK